MPPVKILADVLAQAAQGENGVHFMQRGGREEAISYRRLQARARGLLGALQQRGAAPGDALLLLLRNNLAFVDAFWACQLGAMVPVPLPAGLQSEYLQRLQGAAQCFDDPVLVTERDVFQRLDAGLRSRFGTRVVLIEDITALDAEPRLQRAQSSDTALIQFSSGSTSDPKGVMLSHDNLLANSRAIIAAADIGATDATLSWMPLTHDMGLIGFHLVPMCAGLNQVIMDTELFVRRPARWLDAAQQHRSTLLCSPNFGFQHYLKAVAEPDAQLDLGAVRLIFNGAEPVSASVCRAFIERLQPCGLRAAAMFPVYGLAEASLAVTFPQPGSGMRSIRLAPGELAVGDSVQPDAGAGNGIELVYLGSAVNGCELRICDAGGHPLAEGTIGHVRIRGDNVTRGYYRCPACDAEAFHDDWLDTGDLGAVTDAGLLITGRAKDVIFVAGQNRYPQDIEQQLQEHAGIDAGKVAVCAVRDADNAEDGLLVFVQFRRDPGAFATVAQGVHAALAGHCGLHAQAVIPVHSLPRTSSGKLQRYKLAQAFRDGEYRALLGRLARLAAEPAGEAGGGVQGRLLTLCRQLLEQPAIDARQNLFELGADSLMLVKIHAEIDAAYPGLVEITDLFDHPTVGELAAYIESRRMQA